MGKMKELLAKVSDVTANIEDGFDYLEAHADDIVPPENFAQFEHELGVALAAYNRMLELMQLDSL
jgi:hypothetical protein